MYKDQFNHMIFVIFLFTQSVFVVRRLRISYPSYFAKN